MLDSLLCQRWLILAIEEWFNQTHCVRYSTNINIVMFYYLTSENRRHHVLANILC